MTVPKKWRFDGDDTESAYLAIPQPVGYIWLCPPSKVDQLDEKMESILPSDLVGQHFTMYLMEHSEMVYCDKSGRIVLTPSLIEHAGLDNQAKLVGMFGSWAIWNPDRYAKFKEDPFALDIGSKGRRMLNVMEKIWKTGIM
ncbi:MAG: hypothetical protein O7C75_14545 [Verrucomicrobia bacterium]|nr:hypothetical protein [Verrucomicrobiota bacterium]